MKFAREQLGMTGIFVRPNPYNNKMIHHPDYEPFWSAVEDYDMAVGFHEGGNSGMPQVGMDRFETRGARHIVTHTMEMMMACLSMIWGGVCDTHPKLRVAFLESGGGWIVPWLERMDRHFDDQGFNDSGLSMRPSEIFQRNCWISFEPVEGSLRCSPTISARTRSCGRPTTRIRTASSPARRRWYARSSKAFRRRPNTR